MSRSSSAATLTHDQLGEKCSRLEHSNNIYKRACELMVIQYQVVAVMRCLKSLIQFSNPPTVEEVKAALTKLLQVDKSNPRISATLRKYCVHVKKHYEIFNVDESNFVNSVCSAYDKAKSFMEGVSSNLDDENQSESPEAKAKESYEAPDYFGSADELDENEKKSIELIVYIFLS